MGNEGCDYALGGAIALAFGAVPRGTVVVDVAIYLPVDDPSQTVSHTRQIFLKTSCRGEHSQAVVLLRKMTDPGVEILFGRMR